MEIPKWTADLVARVFNCVGNFTPLNDPSVPADGLISPHFTESLRNALAWMGEPLMVVMTRPEHDAHPGRVSDPGIGTRMAADALAGFAAARSALVDDLIGLGIAVRLGTVEPAWTRAGPLAAGAALLNHVG